MTIRGEEDGRRRATGLFRRELGRSPAVLVRAPGRVNVLGAHVDYSEGWVLPGAIETSLWAAAAPRDDGSVRVIAADVGETVTVELDALPPPVGRRAGSGAGWHDYPVGVLWALQRAGRQVPALDLVIASDLPMGGGVSSSAALEVAVLTAVEALGGEPIEAIDKARFGRQVENEYLGVGSGIMDQYASVFGERDRLLFLDCRTLTHETLPLDPEARVLVADSGVRRRLVGSAFNDRRAECEEAVRRLAPEVEGLRTLRDLPLDRLDELTALLPEPLDRRARHAVEECARVRRGAQMLRAGDIGGLGELMKESHCSSRDLYETSIPELDRLAESAWQVEGCHGARLAGGGFGGCVLALVRHDAVASVAVRMAEDFVERFGRRPTFLSSRIADGAGVVDLSWE